MTGLSNRARDLSTKMLRVYLVSGRVVLLAVINKRECGKAVEF